MKTMIMIQFLLTILFVSSLYGQGIKIDDSFYSVSLDTTRLVDIYLPDGYDAEDHTQRYPVVYFLHGLGSNQDDYGLIIGILDLLIGDDIIDPIIVVKPDGRIGRDVIAFLSPSDPSLWANSEATGAHEDYIAIDLIEYVDSEYNTIASSDKRSIMGHSNGGTNAARIALKYPAKFRALASHSGHIMNPKYELDSFIQGVLSEYAGSGPFDPNAGPTTLFFFRNAIIYSPNLDNPPYYVDFPIDTTGNFIDSVWARWLDGFSPFYHAKQLLPDSSPSIYFDVGTADGNFPVVVAFADSLDSLGFSYVFRTYLGGHNDKLDIAFPMGLMFLDSVNWDGVSRAYNAMTDRSFSFPGEAVNIFTEITNPLNHTLTALAFVDPEGETESDTVELYDDGNHNDGDANDAIWGGVWTDEIDSENKYEVHIHTIDNDSGISHTRWNATRFTKIGPVVYDTSEIILSTPSSVFFKISLKNEGLITLATDITATLTSTDSCIASFNGNVSSFDDISSGERVTSSDNYSVTLNQNCVGVSEFSFDVDILSDGFVFWTDNNINVLIGIENEIAGIPTKYKLLNAYPNPFNPSTTIEYTLPQTGQVSLVIYNLLGEEVTRLISKNQPAGYHNVTWDASNYSSGMYFYRLQAGDFVQTRKMVFLK